MLKVIRWALLALLLTASFAWACAALYFDGPFSGGLAIAFACAAIAVLGWVRPFWKGLSLFAVLFLGVLVYAFWPRNRQKFRNAANIPLRDEEDGRADEG